MNQNERRIYLIRELLSENPKYGQIRIPEEEEAQKQLLRGLFNVRMPGPAKEEFLNIQDAYLKEEAKKKGIVTISDLKPAEGDLYLWQGDITALECGAIVNAANSGMTGCYQPCHNCIDNCIHTYAGVQLRYACEKIMEKQGHEEPAGQAKITPGFNLPAKYVIHTVGPIVSGRLSKKHEQLLESCYRSCLDAAREKGLESIAFCCISTGVFMFPNRRAAEIALDTVKNWKKENGSGIKVIFNVFKETDRRIYSELLGKNSSAK